MKVIVLSSFGNDGLPKIFKCDYSDKLWRVNKNLISRIESFGWNHIELPTEIKDLKQNYKYDVLNGTKYFYATPDDSMPFNAFKIIDVDISRPWCIEEYDGAESVKYLDEYVCISEELNYFIEQ